jgi:hypothetical protein
MESNTSKNLSLKALNLFVFSFLHITIYTINAQTHWTKKSDYFKKHNKVVAFNIEDKGYAGLGIDSSNNNIRSFWQYSPTLNVWNKQADHPSDAYGNNNFGFSLLGKGYVRAGSISQPNDFWQFSPAENKWIPKGLVGDNQHSTFAIIKDKVYLLEYDGSSCYNPVTNTWTSVAPFPGSKRQYGVAFAIGNKGYYGMGVILVSGLNDMWQYNPDSNTWKQMANYNGYIASGSIAPKVFVIGNDAYLMGIENKERYKEADLTYNFFAKYNAISNTWQLISDTLPAPVGNFNQTGFAFSLNGKGYVYTGTSNNNFWEYDPKDIRLQAVSPATAACVVDTILVHYNIVPYKNYNITAQLSSVDDNFSNPITLAIFRDSIGADSIKMALPQGLNLNQNYLIRLISSAGDTSSSERIQINLHPQKPIITKLNNTQLQSTAAAAYHWYLNGNEIANSNAQNITLTQNGSYTVRVDSTNACGTFSDTLIANFVGVANMLSSNLYLYPNPIKNKLQVNMSNDELEELHIYDGYGRLIKTVLLSNKTNEVEIDMSEVQEGFYFISIKSENAMFNKKVMVIK